MSGYSKQNVSVLVGESPIWIKISHQLNTKFHIWGDRKLNESGMRKVSSRSKSDQIEPRNLLLY